MTLKFARKENTALKFPPKHIELHRKKKEIQDELADLIARSERQHMLVGGRDGRGQG